MKIFTIGFTHKSAEEFFKLLQKAEVKRVLDVRIHNNSQLAGYSKRDDLAFFLDKVAGIRYVEVSILRPSEELFTSYRKKEIDWKKFLDEYEKEITDKQVETQLKKSDFDRAVLLCGEAEPDHCHRRVAAEYLSEAWGGFQVEHLV